MQPDAGDLAHPQWQQRPSVLQGAELALNRAALVVERLEPVSLARDQWVQPTRLDQLRLRLALARGTAPLGRLALGVAACERSRPVLALRQRGLAAFTAGVSRSGITGRMCRFSTVS